MPPQLLVLVPSDLSTSRAVLEDLQATADMLTGVYDDVATPLREAVEAGRVRDRVTMLRRLMEFSEIMSSQYL